MLRVVKSESVSGGAVVVRRFVFEFDNGSYLPINTYQLGLTTYIIADDSEGINIEDNSYYIYKNGKWNLSHNEIPISYNDTTITNNGIHSVSNNDIVGYNDVEVDVPSDAPTLIEKTITENGEYSAEDDGADGYSGVSVEVQSESNFNFFVGPNIFPSDTKLSNSIYVRSVDGNYYIWDYLYPETGTKFNNTFPIIFLDPLKYVNKIQVEVSENQIIIFTPSLDFDYTTAFMMGDQYGDINLLSHWFSTYTGDTIVPGDGNWYKMIIDGFFHYKPKVTKYTTPPTQQVTIK